MRALLCCVLCIVVAGSTTAIVMAVLHFTDIYEFGETGYTTCKNHAKYCKEADRIHGAISPTTNAWLCLTLGGILPCCCLLVFCLTPLSESTKEMVGDYSSHCWNKARQCQCPRFERRTVDDSNAYQEALAAHQSAVQSLRQHVESQPDPPWVLTITTRASSHAITVRVHPTNQVRTILEHTAANGANEATLQFSHVDLGMGSTLEAAGAVNGAQLELDGKILSSILEGDEASIPSPLELELRELEMNPPAQVNFVRVERVFRCCTCGDEDHNQLLLDSPHHVYVADMQA